MQAVSKMAKEAKVKTVEKKKKYDFCLHFSFQQALNHFEMFSLSKHIDFVTKIGLQGK